MKKYNFNKSEIEWKKKLSEKEFKKALKNDL